MFKYRIISFPLLLGLLAAMIFWKHGTFIYLVLAPVVLGMAVYEAGRLFSRCGLPNFSKSAAVFSALSLFYFLLNYLFISSFFIKPSTRLIENFFMIFFCLTFFLILSVPILLFSTLFAKDRKQQLLKSAGTFGLLCLIAFPFFLSSILYFPDFRMIFLFFVLVTKATDTGGYVVGMLTAKLPGGNHKIVPSISPKKSWEGTFGGILLSVAVAWALNHCCGMDLKPLPLLLLAVVLALGSFAGDLTESVIKRAAGVKDSNAIIPGMGGVFDVVDSFLYNGFLFLLLNWLFLIVKYSQ